MRFSTNSLTYFPARDKIKKDKVAHVMHYASSNEALIAKPSWGLIGELMLDDDGMRRVHEEKELVLGAQGEMTNIFSHSSC